MSLINDALRKARQAAAEHDARPPDGPFQARKAYPSRSTNRRTGVVLVALVAIAAGLLGAALAWWLTVDHQSSPEPVLATQQMPAAGEPAAPTPETPVDTIDRDGASQTGPAVGQESGAGESDRAPAPDVSPDSPREPVGPPTAKPASSSENTAAVPTPADRPKPNTADSPGAERIFILDADLGYATLNLGFIVARSTNPFAEINGIEVRVGSEIEGFTVEAIEADQVTLRDDQGPLVLRVP